MEETNNKQIRKKIFENLIIAIAIMLYFILMNFAYLRTTQEIITNGIQMASLLILFLSIAVIEVAYHKDSGKIAINGIELLVLAFHALTMQHIVNKYKISFDTYILFSTYTFSIYYILKAMIVYTNERRKYAKSLSDIHEIVSKDPIKKEAKKRNKEENT